MSNLTYLNQYSTYHRTNDIVCVGYEDTPFEGDDIFITFNTPIRQGAGTAYRYPVNSYLNLYMNDNNLDNNLSYTMFGTGVESAYDFQTFAGKTGTDFRNLVLSNVIDSSGINVTGIFNPVGWYNIDLSEKILSDNIEANNLNAYVYLYSLIDINVANGASSADLSEDLSLSALLSNKNFDGINEQYEPYFKCDYSGFATTRREVELQPLEELVQYVNGKFRRIFFKFELPEINGLLRYSYVRISTKNVYDEDKLVFCKILSTDNTGWDSNSASSTMNSIYADSDWHREVRSGGVVETSENYLFNVYAFAYAEGADTNDIKGARWMYDSSSYIFTCILEDVNVIDAPTSTMTGGDLKLGIDNLEIGVHNNSLKTFYGSDTTTGDVYPRLLIGWQTPVINLDTSSFSHSINAENPIATDTVDISNSGAGILNAQISSNADWLSCNLLESGPLEFGDTPVELQLIYDTTSLYAPGDYTGIITLEDLDAEPTSREIVSIVTVHSASFVAVDTTSFDILSIYNRNVDDVTFQIWDGNTTILDTLNWEVEIDYIDLDNNGNPGINIINSSGTSSSPSDDKTVTIEFSLNDYNPGSYTWILKAFNTLIVEDYINIQLNVVVRNMNNNHPSYSNLSL